MIRLRLIHASLALFAAALVARAAHVQLWQGRAWAERAQRQQLANADVPAPRGTIYDVANVPLAESRELVSLSVAPREVRDRRRLARELGRLRLSREWVRRGTDARRAWVVLPGRYLPGDVAAVRGMRGVHATPVFERITTQRLSTRRVVGRVDGAGAVDGLELALDEHLQGRSGRTTVVRDARGRRLASPAVSGVAAEPGDDVVLTINQELQEIAERALFDAAARMGAAGGDIVVLDPHTGEVRALATVRSDRRSAGSPALSEPFEPGSTIKPFMAATLLSLGRARPDEVMNTENGVLTIEGRTIHDVHGEPAMTLRDVIAKSSNVGIVKFTQRLTPREEYEALRDFGFGTPTGVPYPSEAAGVLRAPGAWSRQTRASLAMGYEVSATALQLALAYASFANGGALLEPALVKEIRAADGTVKYRHARRVVRRVMDPRVAATVRDMLRGTVTGGSATEADLGDFEVAGKTGTARRNVRGRYVPNEYTASFVGLFPADRPLYVILVKLDNPTGAYYGGKTAAPVSKAVLEAAVAARDAALDRAALAASARRRAADAPPADSAEDAGDAADAGDAGRAATDVRAVTTSAGAVASAPAEDIAAAPDAMRSADTATPGALAAGAESTVVLALPLRESAAALRAPRPVPDVRGMPLREAVRVLHRAGFRVRLSGVGVAASTAPAAGALAPPGSMVRLAASSGAGQP